MTTPTAELCVDCRDNRQFRFEPDHTALLLIDFQREFFQEGIGASLDEMLQILPRATELLRLGRQLGCRIVYTRESYDAEMHDVHDYRRSLDYVGKQRPLGRFCIRGEAGHEIVDSLKPLAGEPVVDKASFGAFYNTSLHELLCDDAISHLIICGVTTQCCVHSTLREAVDRGYWCLTVADCCAASEPGMHDAALSLIAGEGHLFGWVCDLDQIIRAAQPRL